ncbi:MAG: LamG domain-containing protein [Candidatus Poribacteria bacterium]
MKRILFASATTLLIVAWAPTHAVGDLTAGLVAYFPLDEGSGAVARDATGNVPDGELIGGAEWDAATKKVGASAVTFDGSGGVIEFEPFDVEGGGITLAAWIRPEAFGIGDGRIITKANEWGADDHWWMFSTIDGNVLRFRLKTDDGQGVPTLIAGNAGEPLKVGQWHHVAATWDGADMKVWQDGVEVGALPKGGNKVAVDDGVKVSIGSQPTDAFAADAGHVAKYFDGTIDDVVIYSRALDESEIGDLAQGMSPDLAVEPNEKLATAWGMLKR